MLYALRASHSKPRSPEDDREDGGAVEVAHAGVQEGQEVQSSEAIEERRAGALEGREDPGGPVEEGDERHEARQAPHEVLNTRTGHRERYDACDGMRALVAPLMEEPKGI